MEADSVGGSANPSQTNPEVKTSNDALKPTRISERLIIKRSRCVDEEEPEEKQPPKRPRQHTPRKPKAQPNAKQQGNTRPKGKGTTRENWGVKDKRHFYLGLQQYGKNFKAISTKICRLATKSQKQMHKDVLQVRYFYYRNWRKISQYVDLKGAEVPLHTQELYGLINYGVLQNYITVNDRSFQQYLNDLIHTGKTKIRLKTGRKFKFVNLHTPVCACLKRINRILDVHAFDKEISKLPQSIILELTPRDNKTWARVQEVSQNPRLRVKLQANRSLQSVIKFLVRKWKQRREKNREKLGAKAEYHDHLVIFLHPAAKICSVTMVARQGQKIDVSFSSYKEKVLPTIPKEKLPTEKKSRPSKDSDKAAATEGKDNQKTGSNVNSGVHAGTEQVCEESDSVSQEHPLINLERLLSGGTNSTDYGSDSSKGAETTLVNDLRSECMVRSRSSSIFIEDENAMFPDISSPFSPSSKRSPSKCSTSPGASDKLQQDKVPVSPTIQQAHNAKPEEDVSSPTVGSKKSRPNKKQTSKSDGSGTPPLAAQPVQSGHANDLLKQEAQERVDRLTRLAREEGFTTLNSASVTLWQLSLLLGRGDRVRMQYEWREKRSTTIKAGHAASNVAALSAGVLNQAASQMSNLLRRLCNLATLELTDFKRDMENKYVRSNTSCVCSANAPPKGNATANHSGNSTANHSGNATANHCMRKRSQSITVVEPEPDRVTSRNIAVQTDQQPTFAHVPMHAVPGTMVQVIPQASLVTAGGKTFVAGPHTTQLAQMHAGDTVFRVPLIPAPLREALHEEKRLEEQRAVRSILEQGSNQPKLLKKRRLLNKTRKAPPMQRLTMSNSDNREIVQYIQQPPGTSVNMYNVGPSAMAPQQRISSTVAAGVSNVHLVHPHPISRKSSMTDENTACGAQSLIGGGTGPTTTISTINDCNMSNNINAASSMANTTQVNSLASKNDSNIDATADHSLMSDSSLSNFDLTLPGNFVPSAAPDAGDQFLDSVLKNIDSDKGFSGLLCTPKKSSNPSQAYTVCSNTTASSDNYDPNVLRTPTHLNTSSVNLVTPIKLDLSREWGTPMAAGDISLGAILGEAPSFGDGVSLSADTTSSLLAGVASAACGISGGNLGGSLELLDGLSNDSCSKMGDVVSLSFSSLLGDPSFKKQDDSNTGMSPPYQSSSPSLSCTFPVTTQSFTVTVSGLTSSTPSVSPSVGLGISKVGLTDGRESARLFNEVSQDSFATKLDFSDFFQTQTNLTGQFINESSLDIISKFEAFVAEDSVGGHVEQENGINLAGLVNEETGKEDDSVC